VLKRDIGQVLVAIGKLGTIIKKNRGGK